MYFKKLWSENQKNVSLSTIFMTVFDVNAAKCHVRLPPWVGGKEKKLRSERELDSVGLYRKHHVCVPNVSIIDRLIHDLIIRFTPGKKTPKCVIISRDWTYDSLGDNGNNALYLNVMNEVSY
jgi:hypothetical protein